MPNPGTRSSDVEVNCAHPLDATKNELREQNDASSNTSSLLTYTMAGNMVTFNLICGGTGTQSGEYSASATQFSFFDANNKRVETFTKQ
jgi:hypothetical protein